MNYQFVATRNIFKPSLLALACLSVSGLSTSTLAQSDSRSLLLEEIVVTSQKREQSMQDVGISVTTMNGDQMRALGYKDATDLAAQAPAVEFSSFHQSSATINIRGVSQNDFADHLEPPVAMYVDEAYVPYSGAITAQMFDMERAEILRGPQGTLFGRNATGGLIHLISRAPTEEFEGFVDIEAGEHGLMKVEAAVGGQLTEGLTGRLSVYRHEQDGWWDNRGGKDLMDADNYAYRVQLQYEPNDSLTVGLKIHSGRNNDETGTAYNHTPTGLGADGLGYALADNEFGTWPNIVLGGVVTSCAGCDLLGYKEPDSDPRTGNVDNVGSFNRDIDGATLKITADFDNFSLVSITDTLSIEKVFNGDIDGTPYPYFDFETDQDSSHIAQEFRIDSIQGETFKWMAGLYYLDIESDHRNTVYFDAAPYLGLPWGVAAGPNTADYTIDTKSQAVFFQGEYRLSESVNVIAGVRYTKDEKSMDYFVQDASGPFTFNSSTDSRAKDTFNNYSARLEVDWFVNEEVMVYASYNRGHKAGNFAAPNFGTPADRDVLASILPHDEEVLTAYEAGFKSTLMDGKARLNSAVYYYDYEDYQVFSLQNAAQAIFNRDATVSGAEVELTLNPMDGLDVMLGASAMFDKTVEDVPIPTGSADRDMPMSPDFTFNALVRYEWKMPGGYMAAQADYKWTDDFFFYALNEPITQQESYNVVNARVSYTTDDDAWTFSVWGKNLTEEDYNEFALDIGLLGMCSCTPSAPRWFGGSVTYSW